MSADEPRKLEEIGDDISDIVSNVMTATAQVVNSIRKQARDTVARADELRDLADAFDEIAALQQEAAYRLAQIGAESVSAEWLGDDSEDEEDEDEDIDLEEDEDDDDV